MTKIHAREVFKQEKLPRVLLIDNYDSFTWNVYQYLVSAGAEVVVYRNDKITLDECIALKPTHLVISPGPGAPGESGNSMAIMKHFAGKLPVFGVCLGMQCMYELYGGVVEYAGEIKHGKVSSISHDNKGCFVNLPQLIKVTRYHSLAGRPTEVPSELEVTAVLDNGIIQAVRHKHLVMEGVQFHPEAILTECGLEMFKAFLAYNSGTWDSCDGLTWYIPISNTNPANFNSNSNSDVVPEPNKSNKVSAHVTCVATPLLGRNINSSLGKESDLQACIKELLSGACMNNNNNNNDSNHTNNILDTCLLQRSMLYIMSGNAKDSQISAFLMLLKAKGETASDIAAIVSSVMANALHADHIDDCVDIVGTGGDGHDTFNVSTTAALVCAGAGLRVAKFGNRSSSSKCGSADLCEGYGAKLFLTPEQAKSVVLKTGFCFLHAPVYHPTFRHVGSVRKQLGVKTVFNIIGPLVNPVNPSSRIVGVYHHSIGRLMAETLVLRGLKRGLVVCGHENLDEISIAGPTRVWDINVKSIDKNNNNNNAILEYDICPADFGLPTHSLDIMCGGDMEYNKRIIDGILNTNTRSTETENAALDFVLINAAALLVVAGLATDWPHGVQLARKAITSGRARQCLQDYIDASNQF